MAKEAHKLARASGGCSAELGSLRACQTRRNFENTYQSFFFDVRMFETCTKMLAFEC